MPQSQRSHSTTRAEKLSVLTALLGPEAMAKLGDGSMEETSAQDGVDANRVAWHRNRLLERFRGSSTDGTQAGAVAPETRERVASSTIATGVGRNQEPSQMDAVFRQATVSAGATGVDFRLASNLDRAALMNEHPAVLARLLNALDQPMRVELLKALPGPVARLVVKRLRDL